MYSHEEYMKEDNRRRSEDQEYRAQQREEELRMVEEEYVHHMNLEREKANHDRIMENEARLYDIVNLIECTLIKIYELDR